MIDERIEQLINRKVDGELTEVEALELDKALIRSPEARKLLEQYERTDAEVVDALQVLLSEGSLPDKLSEGAAGLASDPRLRWRAVWICSGLAAAVALAAIIMGIPAGWLGPKDPASFSYTAGQDNTSEPLVEKNAPIEDQADFMVADGPPRYRERTHRDIFGVFDEETKSIYLLERDRTQQTIVPASADY